MKKRYEITVYLSDIVQNVVAGDSELTNGKAMRNSAFSSVGWDNVIRALDMERNIFILSNEILRYQFHGQREYVAQSRII